MLGYLEKVTTGGVKGWAASRKNSGAPVKIRVLVDGTTRAEGTTFLERSDVLKVLKMDSGQPGFSINVELGSDEIKMVSVEALDGKKWVKLKKVPQAKSRAGGYQDFDGTGASKSHEKLKALKLYDITAGKDMQTPLKGKSVLDIGCNEGFFCIEAIRQGAKRVVGIDLSTHFLELAKERCPEAEFHKTTWWNLPNEKFDVILFLSAIHYEPKQQELLNKLISHLTDDGVLILECGVAPKKSIQDCWTTVTRWDGDRRYPNMGFLTGTLLKDYSTRVIGPSVTQTGDPIPRAVLHCRPKKPTAILIGGHSHEGKTTIAGTLHNSGIAVYQTDVLITRLVNDQNLRSKPIAKTLISQFSNKSPLNIAEVGKYIVKSGSINGFTDIIMSEIPVESGTFAIEGEILRHTEVLTCLSNRLKDAGILAWSMTRSN